MARTYHRKDALTITERAIVDLAIMVADERNRAPGRTWSDDPVDIGAVGYLIDLVPKIGKNVTLEAKLRPDAAVHMVEFMATDLARVGGVETVEWLRDVSEDLEHFKKLYAFGWKHALCALEAANEKREAAANAVRTLRGEVA